MFWGANRVRPDSQSVSGVSWLISGPRKKLITLLVANGNYALAA